MKWFTYERKGLKRLGMFCVQPCNAGVAGHGHRFGPVQICKTSHATTILFGFCFTEKLHHLQQKRSRIHALLKTEISFGGPVLVELIHQNQFWRANTSGFWLRAPHSKFSLVSYFFWAVVRHTTIVSPKTFLFHIKFFCHYCSSWFSSLLTVVHDINYILMGKICL